MPVIKWRFTIPSDPGGGFLFGELCIQQNNYNEPVWHYVCVFHSTRLLLCIDGFVIKFYNFQAKARAAAPCRGLRQNRFYKKKQIKRTISDNQQRGALTALRLGSGW